VFLANLFELFQVSLPALATHDALFVQGTTKYVSIGNKGTIHNENVEERVEHIHCRGWWWWRRFTVLLLPLVHDELVLPNVNRLTAVHDLTQEILGDETIAALVLVGTLHLVHDFGKRATTVIHAELLVAIICSNETLRNNLRPTIRTALLMS
jgi:hypothetical protein